MKRSSPRPNLPVLLPVPPRGSRRSIFQEPWWLEAAAGPALERASVVWDGITVASVAFVRDRRFGITQLDMPPYTRTLGPDLNLPSSGPAKHARNLQRAINELLQALPPHDRYHTTLAPEDHSAFPLALAGCGLGQNFTFRSPVAWNLEKHWTDLDQKTRNLIRSASKELAVSRDGSINEMIELAAREHGNKSRVDPAPIHRLAEATASRHQIATLTARHQGSTLAAAATVVWDDSVLYLWQSTRDRAHSRSGAISLLIWEAMQMAHSMGLTFDIDGYHSVASARFVSRFALQPALRSTVLHMSARGRILQAAGRLFGRGIGLGVPPLGHTVADE